MKLLSFHYLLNSRFNLKIHNVNTWFNVYLFKVFFLVRFKRFFTTFKDGKQGMDGNKWRIYGEVV